MQPGQASEDGHDQTRTPRRSAAHHAGTQLAELLDGAWAIASALWVTRNWFTAWPVLFEGTASVAVGLFAVVWPLLPREAVFAIATWGLVTGALELVAAFRVTPRGTGRWLLATGGVCSLFVAGLILTLPRALTPPLVEIIGLYAIAFGISLSAAAVSFRKVLQETPHVTWLHAGADKELP